MCVCLVFNVLVCFVCDMLRAVVCFVGVCVSVSVCCGLNAFAVYW